MTAEETLNLGIMYFTGQLVKRNFNKAFKLFEQAESLGNKEAYRWLGLYYFKKKYSASCCYYEKFERKALKYFEKAIEFNTQDGEILNCLGCCHTYGSVATRDLTKGFRYFLKSAELGNKSASRNLSGCYLHGEGTEKDLEKALYWAEAGKDQDWIALIRRKIEMGA